jgi:hypothetical protein
MTKRTAMLSLLMLLGLVFAPGAWADSQARIVRLSLVDGGVQIDRGQGLEKAIMNMPIAQGVKLSTSDGARAEVEFEDGTTLRMAPRTEIEFPTLGLRYSGARFSTIQLNQGTAYFNVRHKGDDEFRVAFADHEINVDHNVHFRLALTGGDAELAVFKGDLEMKGPQKSVKVKKDETLTLDLGDAGRYDLAKNITPLSYDSWDSDRINYTTQYASSNYASSPYYYGASDMNYYGAWTSWPGYGMLWRPFGVGYGWDPFYNGAWAWYPGFGYTWVSTYPWGWTPYRYGSWLFVPNFGWNWRPGTWNSWYTMPPVYNPPPSFHVPKPPMPVGVAGGGRPVPHPTVVVDNGVGVIRDPRRIGPEGFVDRHVDRSASVPGSAVPGSGSTMVSSPVAGTGISAPGSPMPMRPHSDMRTRSVDGGAVMRGAPYTRVERSAPAPRGSPPPTPRMSAPPAPRMSAPPSGGGHSGGMSGGGHSSGGSKGPK